MTRATAPPRPIEASRRTRRRRWPLVVPWALAVLLAGSLAWALPRAAEASRLQERIDTLGSDAAAAGATVAEADSELADTRDQLREARAQLQGLKRDEGANARKIERMESRIGELQAAAAAAATAAAAPAPAASGTSSAAPGDPVPPARGSIPKYEPSTCTPWVNPSTGEKGCD